MNKNDINTRWDLTLLFDSQTDPRIAKERKKAVLENKKFIKKWKERDDYLKSSEILRQALDDYERLSRNWSNNANEWYYFNLLTSLNQDNPKLKAKYQKARQLGLSLQNDIQFFEMRVAKLGEKTQKKFLKSNILKPYKHFLENLFKSAKYLLTEPEEKIMNLKSTPAHANWVKMTQSFYSKEERKVLTEKGIKETKNFSELTGLMQSTKKRVRDSSADAFNNILKSYIEVAENEINSVLLNKQINDQLRGYERPDKARHIADNIDTGIIDVLVEAVSGKFGIAKKYYKLKAKLMKVKRLKYHERNVPIGKTEKSYRFREAVELMERVYENLDHVFLNIFQEFMKNGQVDVYPKKGKAGGAFCSYGLITHPVYVLLNYNDKINDVRTFAHEFGHAINDEYMRKNQNALNFGTPTSTAEVASTFFEDFVIQELMKEADKDFKLSLMMEKLNQDISSIFRQIAFYKFEKDLHENFRKKGYLDNKEIGILFRKHMASYMGPAVEQSNGSENWWAYIWHFRYFFYVYSYASGLLISKAMQAKLKENEKFISKVKEFLSAGLSDSPKNIFKNLGLDITKGDFWISGLQEIDNLLKDTEDLAKKLKRI
jgi:oligoendopeptidase F